MVGEPVVLYTIGHSAHPIERLVDLLRLHGVALAADVRSHPTSRFYPHFRKRALERLLTEAGIGYVFLGRELGGRPSDPTCYPGGSLPARGAGPAPQADFTLMMPRDWFVAGIRRLLDLAVVQPTAIVCSEEDPARCHRHQLIAAYLHEHHPEVEVQHIRGNGSLVAAVSLTPPTLPGL